MNASDGERRHGDRRANDRRRAGGRRRDDALFATLSGETHPNSESFFDPGWLAAGEMPPDSRLLLRQVRRIAAAQDTALVRVFRTYVAARAVIGVGLVTAQGLSSLFGVRSAELLSLVCLVYAAQAITLWLLPRFRPLAGPKPHAQQRRRQWLATIGVDILAFFGLHLLEVGSSFNYAALLVLPVLMAGVLTSRLLALGTAAAVSLLLLGAASVATFDTLAPGLMLQSGLTGLGLFIITLLAGELAGRLAREELAARGSLELARQQAQLNRLVIEEMADGVLVVDRHLRVRAANPAARSLLVEEGLAPPAPFGLGERAAWRVLHDEVKQLFVGGDDAADARSAAAAAWPEAGRDVLVRFADGVTRTLRVRVRFMRSSALDADPGVDGTDLPDEPFVVLLLEDVRTAQARLRQEKLAAMGRVSAGIAHEIRNPLAAIAQANALLLEDELVPAQQRLARIVADNVARLDRIVDDVLEVAPTTTPLVGAIDARAVIAATTAEWAAMTQLPLAADSRLRVQVADRPLGVLFDAEHLRRVLVNLLDNACRHSTDEPGAVVVRLRAEDAGSSGGGARVVLSVASDGPLIAPEVERYLFEPFYSSRSRGSGLGLYICRELCERYGASIEYRPRPAGERARNEFVVSMRRAELAMAATVLPLEP
ncbi:MAG: histidine kinase [Betaproteobacteria bacterium]|nr:histidine kinase [Betaproteobacteria bacterium]